MTDSAREAAGGVDRSLWCTALLAALALTVANAAKPLVIDDPVYVAVARQIAAHPSDPYGFELFWYDAPEPAMRVGTLAPVLPYWLAGAMTLFGDRPFAWKLSLLPFAFALTGSLAFLLARFAKPLATPVLWTLALGPTVLPGFSLMLDVPAVALGLLGFALFVRACERERMTLALVAGSVLGLAMQTKYAAVSYPALVLLTAVLYRRPREAAVACVAAAALFIGWEALIVARYGESHFLAGIARVRAADLLADVRQASGGLPGASALYWTLALFSLMGGTAIHAALLALVGLGGRAALVVLAGIAAGLAFAGVLVLPSLQVGEPIGLLATLASYNPELVLFAPLGVGVTACVGAAALRLLRRADATDRRADRLLAAWIVLELVAYFVISPYPAVRRVIGLSIAATLLAARAASLRTSEPGARSGTRVATVFGLVLAALYFGSELSDAWARRTLVAQISQRFSALGAAPERETIWYTGHWEFQFYAERAGWRAVIPDESQLRRGDWLVIPANVDQPRLAFAPGFERVAAIAIASPSPWSTIPPYHSGAVPLRRQLVPHASARLYRVTSDLKAQSDEPEAAAARGSRECGAHDARSRPGLGSARCGDLRTRTRKPGAHADRALEATGHGPAAVIIIGSRRGSETAASSTVR